MDVDNQSQEEIKVKVEIEDTSYNEINHTENIECDLNIDVIKQEFIKQEINLESVKVECNLSTDENWTICTDLDTTNCYEKNLFNCPECTVKTKYETNLKKHIMFMHPDSNKQVKKRSRNSRKYFMQKANNTELFSNCSELTRKRKFPFNCSDCSFGTKYKFELIFHIHECHYNNSYNLQSERFVCHSCGRQYHDIEKLTNHSTYCNKVYFQCDYCLRFFKQKWYLKKHIFRKHIESKMIEKNTYNHQIYHNNSQSCPRCGKRFSYSTSLLQHLIICQKDNPFICSTCKFTFCSDWSLAMHVLVHLRKSDVCQRILKYNRI